MKSDKQQMSYVPQTSEHVEVIGAAQGSVMYDIKLPKGAYVEDVRVVVSSQFGDDVQMDLGTTSVSNYYRSTAVDAGTNGGEGVYGIDASKMMQPVASDQIVRVTVVSANTTPVGRAWVWVNYRFHPNQYPTQLV